MTAQRMLIVVGILLGMTLLVIRVVTTANLDHDDSITMLAATCNQSRYATNLPTMQWTTAEEWQDYWSVQQPFCFNSISQGLAQWDIHPPLYFWLLHSWVFVFGVSIASMGALNVVLASLTAIMIYLTGKALEQPPIVCSGMAVIWLLSPATLEGATAIRQYTLLGLTSVVFVWMLIRYHQQPTPNRAAFLAAAALAGLLTHYYFGPIILTAALVQSGIIFLRTGQAKALAFEGAAAVASIIAFVVLHPRFLQSFTRQQEQNQVFSADAVFSRLGNFLRALLRFFLPEQVVLDSAVGSVLDSFVTFMSSQSLIAGVLVGVVLIALTLVGLKHRLFDRFTRDYRTIPGVVGVVGLIGVGGLYVGHVSQAHTMGPRYLMIVAPLLAVALGNVWHVRKGVPYVLVVLLALVISSASIDIWRYHQQQAKRDLPSVVMEGHPIIVDNTRRGVLPRIMWPLSPSTPVYAAMQDDILGQFEIATMQSDVFVYINESSYGNTQAKQDQIFLYFKEHGYQGTYQEVGVYGVGGVHVFQRTDEGE
jgi:uncharacterized membrane protein